MSDKLDAHEAAHAFDEVMAILDAHTTEMAEIRREVVELRRRMAAAGDILSAVDPDRVQMDDV